MGLGKIEGYYCDVVRGIGIFRRDNDHLRIKN